MKALEKMLGKTIKHVCEDFVDQLSLQFTDGTEVILEYREGRLCMEDPFPDDDPHVDCRPDWCSFKQETENTIIQ